MHIHTHTHAHTATSPSAVPPHRTSPLTMNAFVHFHKSCFLSSKTTICNPLSCHSNSSQSLCGKDTPSFMAAGCYTPFAAIRQISYLCTLQKTTVAALDSVATHADCGWFSIFFAVRCSSNLQQICGNRLCVCGWVWGGGPAM